MAQEFSASETINAPATSSGASSPVGSAVKLLGPVIRSAIANEDRNQLSSLKALVERG